MRQRIRRVRAACEWLPITLALRGVPLLSRSALLRLARLLGGWACACDRRGRRIGAANLAIVYGRRLTPRRRRLLLRGCYRHAARVLLDLFWFGGREGGARIDAWCVTTPEMARQLEQHRPAIIVTGHFGNWEIAGQMVVASGWPLTSVVKRMGSDDTTAKLNALRRARGQQIVLVQGAVRGLLRALRAGSFVALLQDQHTDPNEGGEWVDFLGLPAAVSGAAARLALKTGVPVHVAYCHALKGGGYSGRLLGSLDPATQGDALTFTQQITNLLTGAIRRHPSQWLATYKRWKRIPPGADAAAFPSYARPWKPPPG